MAIIFSSWLKSFRDKALGIMPNLGIQMDGSYVDSNLGAFWNECAIQINILMRVSCHEIVDRAISSQVLLDHHIDIVKLL